MIMNMQNLNQNHNAVLPPAQSMGNMSALNSRTNIDEQESRLRMSQEETMDEDECEVRGWMAVCTHFYYDVVPCFYYMMGLDGALLLLWVVTIFLSVNPK